MRPNSIAVVGAAETTRLGRIPDVSVIGLRPLMGAGLLLPYTSPELAAFAKTGNESDLP